MEAAESPLDVLSRAAVMLQRNVLPPSYDEARSLSQQQQQKQKLQRKYKAVTSEIPVINSTTVLNYDQSNHNSGKRKWEKNHLHRITGVPSTCDSTLNECKTNIKSSRSNAENGLEPLDMSKRPSTKDRGEPPSYFQSILNSKYIQPQSNASSMVLASNDESSCTSSNNDDKETMCDQVINEHFRRSLGRDYVNVFSASKKHENQIPVASQSDEKNSEQETASQCANGRLSPSPLSVDDHFAKALGDTWIKLQQQEKQQSNQNKLNTQPGDED